MFGTSATEPLHVSDLGDGAAPCLSSATETLHVGVGVVSRHRLKHSESQLGRAAVDTVDVGAIPTRALLVRAALLLFAPVVRAPDLDAPAVAGLLHHSVQVEVLRDARLVRLR